MFTIPKWVVYGIVLPILFGGTPKSSILIGFSITNHPAIGDPPFMETPISILINNNKPSPKSPSIGGMFTIPKWVVYGIVLPILFGGTPKSSILIGFSITNHPAIGESPIYGNHHFYHHKQ